MNGRPSIADWVVREMGGDPAEVERILGFPVDHLQRHSPDNLPRPILLALLGLGIDRGWLSHERARHAGAELTSQQDCGASVDAAVIGDVE